MNATFHSSRIALIAATVSVVGCSSAPESAESTASSVDALDLKIPRGGRVITETNASDRNELVAYERAPDGTLMLAGRFDTGGRGTGAGLSAQGAVAREGRWLFAVNAGSNEVSMFDLGSDLPRFVSRSSSGGTEPVSVTAHDDLVYVLNAGGAGNVAGFRLDEQGALQPIASLALSGEAVSPTEVAFAPDGDTLIVTEKGTNTIDTYFVDRRGIAHGPRTNASNGPAPFGFDFSRAGEVFVSEAAQSAASAYAVRDEVHLQPTSASVLNGQVAACWLVVSPDGRFAFTANAGNGTLSSYRIGERGELALASGIAGATGSGSHPVDMAFAAFGRYLYALANQAGTITGFRSDGGDLTKIGSVDSLPVSATGLVAW
jgi:6-phosphogluconolactonase (cycloisomerase 2 family)